MIQTLFAVPGFTYKIKNWKQAKKKVEGILKKYPCIKQRSQNFLTNRWSPQVDHQTLIADVFEIVKPYINTLAQQTRTNLNITAAWATSYKKGMDHLLHNHAQYKAGRSNSWSGVLYTHFDPKEHQRTAFKQPFPSFETCNIVFVVPPVTEGTLIITPSMLEHFTPPNQSKKVRTIIGFDMENTG